ncbi:MAG: membrane-bound lytic murein transglycosylase D [Myxococcota bacterium]|jgi:membrane-bound lytic murein transglycosylase D
MWLAILLLTIPQAGAQEETLWDRIREAAEEEAEDAERAPGNGKDPKGGDGKPPSEVEVEQPVQTTPPEGGTEPGAVEPDATEPGASEPVEEETERPRPPTTAELLLRIDPKRFEIPVAYTPEVIHWVEYFTGPGRSTMRSWLGRSTVYGDLIQGELIKARMPTDLMYLAMIESGFSLHAHSTADAVGPWQFIESTALNYDLRVDEWVDERRDPVASTRAAIRYLRKLKNDFGNWYVAFAAYNAGEGLVFSAIRNYGTIDYWALARVGALPQETSDYVPKMLAALIIAKNTELFGFNNINWQPARPLEAAEVEAGLEVAHMAKSAGLSEEDFLTYNPHLIADRLPDEPEMQRIWLPPGGLRAFYAALANRPLGRSSDGQVIAVEPEAEVDLSHHIKHFEDGQTTASTPVPPAGTWVSHQVRRGESLATVARRYNCTAEEIRGWNGLEADARPVSGQVLWLKSGGS